MDEHDGWMDGIQIHDNILRLRASSHGGPTHVHKSQLLSLKNSFKNGLYPIKVTI